MPVYDYECERCGPFTTMRPMAECDVAAECPRCGGEAPRAFRTAPYFAMPAARRLAHAINERSAHTPQRLSEAGGAHAVGCRCCGGRWSSRLVKRGKNGNKSFPTSRPWMISH